jgi:autotransporter-associated beta strand protein
MPNRPLNRFVWVLFTLATCIAVTASRAATSVWDGGGTNNFWLNATNWVGDVAPSAGDDLVFPTGAAQSTSFNDFPAATTFNSITIGAPYTFSGQSIALNAGIIATNGNATFFNNALILNSNQTFTLNVGTGVSFNLFGPINNNGHDLTFSVGSGTLAQVQSVISGAGGIIKTGAGNALLYASNTFSGPVQINQGAISIYNGHSLGDTNANTTVASGATLPIANPITVAEPLVLSGSLNSVGAGQVLTGPVTLAASNVTILVGGSSSLAINGIISGNGGITYVNPGTLTLNANNTYTGTNILTGGSILVVNGSQPNTPIAITLGVLQGTGTVGTVTFAGPGSGTLSPAGNGAGILTCSNLVLRAGVNFAVNLNGTTLGTGYDQVNVHGTVALSNANLALNLGGFTPALGDTFTILNNDGVDAISGTFSGLPSGALLTNGATIFRIAYNGGDGNDVTLTTTLGAPPSTITSITNLPNAFKQITGQGLSNLTYTVQATTNLTPPVTWIQLGPATANTSGIYQFTDTNAPAFPLRFYRAVSP